MGVAFAEPEEGAWDSWGSCIVTALNQTGIADGGDDSGGCEEVYAPAAVVSPPRPTAILPPSPHCGTSLLSKSSGRAPVDPSCPFLVHTF